MHDKESGTSPDRVSDKTETEQANIDMDKEFYGEDEASEDRRADPFVKVFRQPD